jgi:hypothetical protein
MFFEKFDFFCGETKMKLMDVDIVQVRRQYRELTGKNPPPNKIKDVEWIQSRICELSKNENETTNKEELKVIEVEIKKNNNWSVYYDGVCFAFNEKTKQKKVFTSMSLAQQFVNSQK